MAKAHATPPATRSFSFGQVLDWNDLRGNDVLVHWVHGRRDINVFLLHSEDRYLVCSVRYQPSQAWVVLDTFARRESAIASAVAAAF